MKKLLLVFICLLPFAFGTFSQTPVTLGPRPDIVELEYFFDTDPGPGNGTAITISADSIISSSFNADISGLDVGWHILHVRTLDEDGKWSLAHVTEIYKAPAYPSPAAMDPRPDIVAAEYFFDSDPGQGNGTRVNFTGDSLISESFNADISGLSVGRHLLYARTLDENGKWSLLTYVTMIFKAAPAPVITNPRPDIVEIEYFFDTDPGQGNGTSVSVAADTIISESFNADISGLAWGRHLLYARTRDENGKWTHANYITTVFKAAPDAPVLDPRPDIIAMEYFFDTDPGPGNGTAVSIVADSVINEGFNADISGLDWGRHLLYVRTLDEDGKWSEPSVAEIIQAASFPTITPLLNDIVRVEYYFDTDPGQGNGTPVIFSPDSIVDVDFMMDLSSIDIGDHLVYVRALDESGQWTVLNMMGITKRMKRLLRHGQFFNLEEKQPIVKP